MIDPNDNNSRRAGFKRKRDEPNDPRNKRRDVAPSVVVQRLYQENNYIVNTDSIPFVEPTEEMMAGYTFETMNAIRRQDVSVLRELVNKNVPLDCCNRYGEALIHWVCRRGNLEMAKFLVEEANVTLMVRDDFGRSALHFACWTSQPSFELVDYILRVVPDLFAVKDVRGHTPLDYVRKEHWKEWNAFLNKRRALLHPRFCKSSVKKNID